MLLNEKYFSEAHKEILGQLSTCYKELFEHSGHGKMSIEMRFLKRGQKEILINCGREYRFTVDCCETCSKGKPCEREEFINEKYNKG